MKEVEDLARALFAAADPGTVWAAIDECERLHWRRQAQQQLAAKRYTAESV
jgi:hypothetical protein